MSGIDDHPVVGRYTGSVLQSAAIESFAQVAVPASVSGSGYRATLIEGKVSSYFYIEPAGKTALEVFRNYQDALSQGQFKPLYSCELNACNQIRSEFRTQAVRPRKWAREIDPAGTVDRDIRFLSAKATRNGTDVYVIVMVGEPDSVWGVPAAVVMVVEPASVELGQVVVNTDQLRAGLASDGKIALYGLYFDTAKADVKPKSKPQMDEMARLLTADKALKVTIVGHTDNEGSPPANLALSKRRAEAVVASLTSQYHVDAGRLRAEGVAALAPVATNRNETGRAKNRRVEMVEQ